MKSLLADTTRTGRLTPTEPYQRFAYWCAALLVTLAILLLVSDSTESRRVRIVSLGAVGYGLLALLGLAHRPQPTATPPPGPMAAPA